MRKDLPGMWKLKTSKSSYSYIRQQILQKNWSEEIEKIYDESMKQNTDSLKK
jgi:hypothetical protein